MDESEKDSTFYLLFEILPICHKIVLNSLDLKQEHLTKTQLFILLALTVRKTLNMSQVASYIASSKEQATRAVAPLVEHGLVERTCDSHNRKLVLIFLTETGKKLVEEGKSKVTANLKNSFQSLTPEDRATLYHSLASTLQILKKLA